MKNIRRILFLRYKNEHSFAAWHDSQFIAELSVRGTAFSIFEFPRQGRAEPNLLMALEQALKAPQPGDVVLNSLFDDIQDENGLFDMLRDSHIPSITVCFDNLQVWYRHRKSAEVYDVLWITSPDIAGHFSSSAAKVVYMPYAANPDLAPNGAAAEVCSGDLVFVGNPYGARALYLDALARAGVPLRCYGGQAKPGSGSPHSSQIYPARQRLDWDHWSKRFIELVHMMSDANGRRLLRGGLAKRFKRTASSLPDFFPLGTDEYGAVIATSRLVLNSAVVWNSHLITHPVFKGHLRIFETASVGGLQLIEAHDELGYYFEPGKELITFSDRGELVELAQFYLDPKQADTVRAMKDKARRRAHAEHRWSHRFEVLDGLL